MWSSKRILNASLLLALTVPATLEAQRDYARGFHGANAGVIQRGRQAHITCNGIFVSERTVEQINTAVTQMDQVTQSNAANAEESASASEEFSAQAEELKGMVVELEHPSLACSVSAVLKEPSAVTAGDRAEASADGITQGLKAASPDAPQVGLELGPEVLDGVEVRRVRR